MKNDAENENERHSNEVGGDGGVKNQKVMECPMSVISTATENMTWNGRKLSYTIKYIDC